MALLAWMALAGMLGSSAASRRAAGRCSAGSRATSAGSRSASARRPCPAGAALASFTLPPLASAAGVDAALYALAGVMLVAALAAAVWLREGPRVESAAPPAPDAARDPRIWRLSAASSLMIIGQVGVTSLLVLYLYSERGWSAAHAALALGVVQVGAAVARVSAGRWSDLRDERIEPFRRLAALAGVLLLAAAVGGPMAVPLLMAGGVAAMSWNGLSFTAAAEISGRRQAGKAMGIQNTAMRVVAAGVPVGLGALASAVSWPAVFVVMGMTPLVARALLGSARRRRAAPPPGARGAPRITPPCRRDELLWTPSDPDSTRAGPLHAGARASRPTTSCGAGRSRTSRGSGASLWEWFEIAGRATSACSAAARCRAPSGSRARR